MLSLRVSVFFILALSAALASAANVPKTFDNQYKAKLYGFNITVTNRLTKTADNQYDLLFKAESFIGSITEQSKMEWNPAQQTVSPLHYSYARRGLSKDRTAELSFDWKNKSVTNNVQKTSWQMDIAQKVQDKLNC